MRNFNTQTKITLALLFVFICVICGYFIEKHSNTGFIYDIASEEENRVYNDTGNRIIDGKININTADAEEISSLEGIGEKTAQAIVDYRTEHGPFGKIEDIMLVNGIGEKTFDSVKDKICTD